MQRILIALLLFIVGTGNIVFGLVKLEEYQALATLPLNLPNHSELLEPSNELSHTDKLSPTDSSPTKIHLRDKTSPKPPAKHENRLQFYRLTVITGCSLLIFSIILQWSWWFRKPYEREGLEAALVLVAASKKALRRNSIHRP